MSLNNKIMWSPPSDIQSGMTRFTRYVKKETGCDFPTYDDLHAWSIEQNQKFWELIWHYFDIIHSQTFEIVFRDFSERRNKSHEQIRNSSVPGGDWFNGARLNFAENLLRFRDERTAIIYCCEGADTKVISFRSLFKKVAECASGLRAIGVQKDDRVAGFMTNCPEAIIAMLATTSIGACWTSCSPDFGIEGVLDRFKQVEPKVLFAVDGYQYGGKEFNCRDEIKKIATQLPELEKLVTIPKLSGDFSLSEIETTWDTFLDYDAKTVEFEQLPFDHPIYIMYSSGTTGIPKCIVHGAGGTLLQHLKELSLHSDLSRADTITYFTTCGWMMWNWLVSSLAVGASALIFDGSPGFPDLNILWKTIEKQKVTIFGTSPKFLSSCQKMNINPKETFDLSSLKAILSTGAPLSSENFNWVYDRVKSDLRLSSISGGTDIISCFMLGNPDLPVRQEEIQCRGLGMNVQAFNRDGKPAIGQRGELVCVNSFPSMPVYFWNDPDGEKYRKAYFDHYPGVWRHGDFIEITPNGGIIVYGRSDATLNPGGVRIGTAEIYRSVESLDEVIDSIVIGQQQENDVRIVLFVVLSGDLTLDEELIKKIKKVIRSNNTPRHTPARILQIAEVPVTLSGKKVELAVKNIIEEKMVTNRDALANPNSLDQFEKLKDELNQQKVFNLT